MKTKKAIFKAHLTEWLVCRGNREKRGEMIKEISNIAKIHPNSVSRSFKRIQFDDKSSIKKCGRKIYYGKDVDAALFDVWNTANRPCGELLKPLILEYVDAFKKLKKWKHTTEATDKLLKMSEGTIKDKTKTLRKKYGIFHGKSTTSPSSIKHIIPIFKGPWDNLDPGNGQLDTVAHCGNTVAGDFVYTVSYVDSAVYWGVRRAQWNKGQTATKENFIAIKKLLPFKWLMGHPDTGSEFINWIAKDWFDENDIKFTRSEPGKKNDNMYIEERNGHVVRKYLGWQRLDANSEIVPLINDYYEKLDIYLNHFQAVRRTLSKEKIGSKYYRKYEKIAKSPYQRTVEHKSVSAEVKNELNKKHQEYNPLILKQEIDILHIKIFDYQKTHSITNV